jgi:TolA-binding protein
VIRLSKLASACAVILLLAACADHVADLFDDAEKLWLAGRHTEAVSKLRVIVEEYPNSAYTSRALIKLGEIHDLDLNEPDKAIDFLARAAEKEGKSDLALIAQQKLAGIYEQSFKNYDLAIMQYQRIMNEYKGKVDEEEYMSKMSEAYFKKGDYAQVILESQELLSKRPNGARAVDARYQIANAKFIMGDAKNALELFRKILQDYPKSKYEYDVRLGVAICLEEMEQLPKALEEYNDLKKRYSDKALIDKKIESVKKRLSKKSTK